MKVFIVDSFTNQTFKGNPAAVCLVENELSKDTMQAIANEFNLSETAFVKLSSNADSHHAIRYFTPIVEIEFCGHATLASAKVLIENFNYSEINFTTFSNLKINAKAVGESIKMVFPLYSCQDIVPSEKLLKAFKISNPVALKFAKELNMLLVEVASKEILEQINPNFNQVVKNKPNFNLVVVTAKSNDKDYDFYSRCFCPWIGINEDPATGSAHSVLAKYWGDILKKEEMTAYQASKRGGFMHLKILNTSELEITSMAKIVLAGNLNFK